MITPRWYIFDQIVTLYSVSYQLHMKSICPICSVHFVHLIKRVSIRFLFVINKFCSLCNQQVLYREVLWNDVKISLPMSFSPTSFSIHWDFFTWIITMLIAKWWFSKTINLSGFNWRLSTRRKNFLPIYFVVHLYQWSISLFCECSLLWYHLFLHSSSPWFGQGKPSSLRPSSFFEHFRTFCYQRCSRLIVFFPSSSPGFGHFFKEIWSLYYLKPTCDHYVLITTGCPCFLTFLTDS